MIQADSLWLMFDRLPVHDGVLELVDNGLVNLVTAARRLVLCNLHVACHLQVFNCTSRGPQHDWCRIIRHFA